MNGHCVWAATDTLAFVGEKQVGAAPAAPDKQLSVQGRGEGSHLGGNTAPRAPREVRFKFNSNALFMKTRLLGILIIW